ncbi:TRNA-guanine transglycosylase family protein [Penicillium chermesinum]|uniref:Queuine tRNA-ribosyltransferase accessory subunit 2 n=1 Tax=Penicillium chermesinum TaxID=63820 RepID=A0A9W9TI74_9EURO|nr:TRNA-guanine transglycosylase family protein [Penicillium chermesinum]KAJ5223731.1 TRNA-guanine transglycosylase family protein [Penicillium chermesinum]
MTTMDPATSNAPEMTFTVLGVLDAALHSSNVAGAVPHIAHDVVRKHTAINGLYIGLEDYMPLILGPRRVPPIACPAANTETSIAILTSVGFGQLTGTHYIEAARALKPDIVIGLADLIIGRPPGVKRRSKMVDRTHAYTQDTLERLYGDSLAESEKASALFFAPILPLDNTQQSLYLEDLEGEFRHRLFGLALYESASLSLVPEGLGSLPRLLLSEPSSPQDLLREISLGADLLAAPFVDAASDSGIALDFSFPAPSSAQHNAAQPLHLGFDLWSSVHTIDTSPLREGCACYACKHHHRAYFHHLLSAKEMSAWALLQIHNHHIIDLFFAGVRDSIQRGSFEEDVEIFNRAYASKIPDRTGQGPRLRGYQLPASAAHQPPRNPKAYGRLDDVVQKLAESESSVATPDTDSEGLEKHGFAEKA